MDNATQTRNHSKIISRIKRIDEHCPQKRLINTALIFILQGLRPLLGAVSCKHAISCGNYAIAQLKTKPLCSALFLATKQVLSCHPFN